MQPRLYSKRVITNVNGINVSNAVQYVIKITVEAYVRIRPVLGVCMAISIPYSRMSEQAAQPLLS